MGFKANNGNGPIADINVTPFVDVMLVLLVIFMITAPLMFNGIELTLPKTQESNSMTITSEQVVLNYTSSFSLTISASPTETIVNPSFAKDITLIINTNKNFILYLRITMGKLERSHQKELVSRYSYLEQESFLPS